MDCYVLTGGLSSRMGSPKQELLLDGRSFLDRVAAAADQVFDHVTLVAAPGGTAESRWRTIFDFPHQERASVFGLLRALEDEGGDRCWILAVDFPLVTPALLRELAERFTRSSARALIPFWNGAPQMLCAGYARTLACVLRERIARTDYRLRGLLEEPGIETVDEIQLRRLFPGEPLRNVNTLEDLEKLRREHEPLT
ncbi:MAG: molybdenum cofactor guanylyltransferase [Thermoanaerobaculia bacterium]